MHLQLAQYIKDNKEHILENWLTEADVPAATHCNCKEQSEGIIPLSYLNYAVDEVIQHFRTGSFSAPTNRETHLNDFLGHTCSCRNNTRICTEIRDAGYVAFLSIFKSDWDIEHEFDDVDREYAGQRIGQILTEFFNIEIANCALGQISHNCPHHPNIN